MQSGAKAQPGRDDARAPEPTAEILRAVTRSCRGSRTRVLPTKKSKGFGGSAADEQGRCLAASFALTCVMRDLLAQ